MEFINANKIRYIISCNASEHLCSYGKSGLKYFDLHWAEKDCEDLHLIYSKYLEKIEKFIEKSEESFEGLLLVCNNGQNRSLSVIVLLLMRRYRWSFYKTLEFLDSKRSNLEIKKNYFNTLKSICDNYQKDNPVSSEWKGDFKSSGEYIQEEILLSNTFLNSKLGSNSQFIQKSALKDITRKTVRWIDLIKSDLIKKSRSVNKQPVDCEFSNIRLPQRPSSNCSKRKKNQVKTEANESQLNEDVRFELEDKKEGKFMKDKREKNEVINKFADKKLIENFIKNIQKTKEKNENNVIARASESTKEFYKKGLKDLQKKIFLKKNEQSRKEVLKNSLSKISTKILEDSSKNTPNDSDPQIKNKESSRGLTSNNIKVRKTKQPEVIKESNEEKKAFQKKPSTENNLDNILKVGQSDIDGQDQKPRDLKRPSSAPSKDEQKQKLIQKHLFFDTKGKTMTQKFAFMNDLFLNKESNKIYQGPIIKKKILN